MTPRSATPTAAWVVAALSFGAGAIHLVMVPQHAQESLGIGLAFAAAGWFQIACGVVLVMAPRRTWLWLAVGGNAIFVATWAISRTFGLPDWTGDGGVQDAHAADLVCVAFEVAIVVGALALLLAPRLVELRRTPAFAAVGVVVAAVLIGTTAVLASPSTANHVHGSDDQAHLVAGAHDHGAASDASNAEGASTAAHTHDTVAGGHVHAESTVTYAKLPAKTKAEVDAVIARWANRYPTAADAQRDGWFPATRSLYGIGAHFVKGGFGGASTFDALNPNILLFHGEGPDAKFAGVSYVLAEIPEGFTGPYDSWHSHPYVCVLNGVISLTAENSPVWYSESECTARGGRLIPRAEDQMMHLWIGPDYINDAPIFAHDHPKLYDGYHPKRAA